MNLLSNIISHVYNYCTDFIINLANISGLSYYEINFIIFILIYPTLFLVSPALYIIQKRRLKKLKSQEIQDNN